MRRIGSTRGRGVMAFTEMRSLFLADAGNLWRRDVLTYTEGPDKSDKAPGTLMPTVLRIDGFRFFFYSLENNEPPHIHMRGGLERGQILAASGGVGDERRLSFA